MSAIWIGACFFTASAAGLEEGKSGHTFVIGTNDFLLDNKPLQIRCGEIRGPGAARVLEKPFAVSEGDGAKHRLRLPILEPDGTPAR